MNLLDFIETIEKCLNIKADKKLKPLQIGDVPDTYANVDELVDEFNYKPNTSIEKGIGNFINWYLDYYKI